MIGDAVRRAIGLVAQPPLAIQVGQDTTII